MHELWSSASYDAHLLSLPFAFAPAAMSVVIAYGIVMRGEPVLRAWMLLHFVSLIPYAITMALLPSVTSPATAEQLLRIAAAFVPMAAAGGLGLHLRLTKRSSWLVWVAVAIAVTWIVVGAVTNLVVDGVYRLELGGWYAEHGRFTWLGLVSVGAVSIPGFALLAYEAIRAKPSAERRQLRAVLAANVLTYAGITEVTLAWHVGVFPYGCLLAGAGSILMIRALIFEDLLRVRAVDATAPRVLLHLGAAILLGWATLSQLGPALRWWGATLVMLCVFAGVRVTISVFQLISRGGHTAENTLDRLLGQLTARARTLRGEAEVAQLAADVIQLGVGVHVEVLIAAAEDYSWTTAAGTRLSDAASPDPLLGAWLAEHPGAVYAEATGVPDDLRPLLIAVLADNGTLVPVVNRGDLLAIVLVPVLTRRQRRRVIGFVERAAERLGEGLVHARMAKRAADRATLAREVELAATVQAKLLPTRGPHVHGDVTVVGSWQPATRCAGDYWGFFPLGPHRLLLAIGDVTGHGVASATVTAAAAAACDVAVRKHGAQLALPALTTAIDAAVSRVGGGQLAMTLFAAIIDGDARTISYVSCGHAAPYLLHPSSDELHVLVGRGNPLGSGSRSSPKVQTRPLRAGDLLVWYTDGVIEAQDPHGEPFGDRRMQRLLRRLDRAALVPPAVHDVVHASVAAHRAGRPRADDETLVVAQWQPPVAASVEPAQRQSSP